MEKNRFISEIVLKVSSRCNINCTYCYMYNMGDNSYLKQPKFISIDIVKELAKKIKKHCIDNDVHCFSITFHGGEPLLLGKEKVNELISILRSIEDNDLEIRLAIQTNGILIDEEWCAIFKKHDISIGVSLDGAKEVNDERRIDHKGNGTYDRVLEGIRKLTKNDVPFGVLTVTNPKVDPIKAYEHYKGIDVKGFDFLILDENYDNDKNFVKYETADWLISVFERWFDERDEISIRIFENIIKGVYGLPFASDAFGKSPNTAIVVESNGAIEALDVLKICGEKFTKGHLHVLTNELDDVFTHPLLTVYYEAGRYLSKKCLACPVQDICGGGYIPHRYSSKNGFNNPSIYCDDLLKLITHIQNKVVDSMPEELKKESNIEKLTFKEAVEILESEIEQVNEPEYVELLESFSKREYA